MTLGVMASWISGNFITDESVTSFDVFKGFIREFLYLEGAYTLNRDDTLLISKLPYVI